MTGARPWVTDTSTWAQLVELLGDSDCPSELETLYRVQLSLDLITRQAVLDYRADGWSWSQVGGALGMTKQAAQQRFGRKTVRVHPSMGNLPPVLEGL